MPEANLQWLPNDTCLEDPDPLMQETLDFLRAWHHGRDSEEDDPGEVKRKGLFEKRLETFRDMWNGSFTGHPMHRCALGHCSSRVDACHKMAESFIALLLLTLPAIPAPNKWTKIFPASDFVGLGLLINNYLPKIFELAFQPVMFRTDLHGPADQLQEQQQDTDPRLLEGLYFHAVQGKRYLGSRCFLTSYSNQWAIRCWLVVSEHLRRLVFYWLRNLSASKKPRNRYPILELLDVRSSVAWAVLQCIAHQLMDPQGRHRISMIWRSSGHSSYAEWCRVCSDEVRDFRRALLSLAAWIYRRHVFYWQQGPWPLLQLIDSKADASIIEAVKLQWDGMQVCCASPGLARQLKQRGISADLLQSDPTWSSVLRGYAALLDMSIADVETKHALSRHWSERPFSTIVAKHVNREALAAWIFVVE